METNAINTDTPIWQLTVGQLTAIIREALPTPATPQATEEQIFITEEAAEYLNVSISTIHRWVKSQELPSQKIGGILRFKKSDLDNMMKKNTIVK